MRLVWLIIAFIIFLIVVGFALLNAQLVSVNFYVVILHWPLSALLLIFFVIGGLLGLAVGCCRQCLKKRKSA